VYTWEKTQDAAEPTSRIPVKVNRKHSKRDKGKQLLQVREISKINSFTTFVYLAKKR
jgi:hypothetical protein